MDIGRSQVKCGLCNKSLNDFKYIAMPEWDISKYLCGSCYSKKLSEYYIKREKKE
jgi:hypothetical protein